MKNKDWMMSNLMFCVSRNENKKEESELKKSLGIDMNDDDFKHQPYMLQISQIGAIGKSIDTGGSFIEVSGCSMQSKESPEEIFELMEIFD